MSLPPLNDVQILQCLDESVYDNEVKYVFWYRSDEYLRIQILQISHVFIFKKVDSNIVIPMN